MADAQTRHSRGLLVVIALAVIFFTLLGLIILKSDDRPRTSAEANETLTVLPVRIRIRTEPHGKAPVVTTATTGERVTMVEDRGAWVRVKNGEGLTGWAERANLERTVEAQRRTKKFEAIRKLPPLEGVAHGEPALYAGPGVFYPLVGSLNEGDEVTVYTRDHDFYAIARGNGVAYVEADAIDITAAGMAQFEVRTPPGEPAATATELDPPQTAEVPEFETPPAFEPEPEPEPEPERELPVERSTGVYSAVPPGGSQPRELDRVVPRYPNAARRAGVEGSVIVRGIVRRDGTIDNLEILKDLPHGLGDEARRAVSRWRFRPATYRGEPIDVYYTVTVNFRLQ
jgi:TonB family protein